MYIVYIILLILMLGLLLFTGKIFISSNIGTLKLSCTYWFSYTILFSEILSVFLLENFSSYGIRLCGLGNFKCGAGLFYNKEYGKYILYSDLSSKKTFKSCFKIWKNHNNWFK